MRILAVCGSLQSKSSNFDLLQSILASVPLGVDLVIDDHLRTLPLFNLDLEEETVPTSVSSWRQALSGCDALLVASPEYGHSLPGALKNGIDWVIGSGEINGKAVAITAAVGHPERGASGLRALSTTLQAIDANIVWHEAILSGEGASASIQRLLETLIAAAGRSKINC